MKFKVYKLENGKPLTETVITDADPVRLIFRVVDRCGHVEWEVRGISQDSLMASHRDRGYVLEISNI
jgi:hypothetical protein